ESTDEELAASTARNLLRLRAHGVVVAEGKSGYGLSLKHELRQLEAIKAGGEAADMFTVRTCLAAHSLPMEYRGDVAKREEYLKLVCEEVLPAAAKDGLASRADIFCEKGVFSIEDTKRVAEAAHKAGLSMTVHADQLHAFGGAAVAAEIGAHSADHLEFTDQATMQKMAEAGTAAVILPGATYALKMTQWADGAAMINAGLCVALATDFNPGSSPIANPAFIMNLAVMHCGLTPEQALVGFTRNAAHALRLNTQEWGCIQVGSRAAFAIWDVDNEAEIPYYAGSNLCSRVITCKGWRS
ncbi:MAG: amidohydrolase family protein, partial [Planctomycetes bacterium]|nr:amidohydrolase family protein [Planctomycetota bacterium]